MFDKVKERNTVFQLGLNDFEVSKMCSFLWILIHTKKKGIMASLKNTC